MTGFPPAFCWDPVSPFEQLFLSKLTLQKKKVVPALSSQEHTLDYSKQIQKRKKRSCSSWGHDPATASRQRNSKNQSTKCAVLPKSHMSSFISEMGQGKNRFQEFLSRFLTSWKWKNWHSWLTAVSFQKKVPYYYSMRKSKNYIKRTKKKKSLLKLPNQGVYVWVYSFKLSILFFPKRDL